MNKLSAFIAMVAILTASVVSATHADAHGIGLCDGIYLEASHDHGNNPESASDCTSCGHHHHSHASLPLIKSTSTPLPGTAVYGWANASHFSHQHSPPARPPRT